MSAIIASVNVSSEKGVLKQSVSEALIDGHGIEGDAHAGDWHRQISILSRELIDEFQEEMGRDLANGEFAENITTLGLNLAEVGLMDRIQIGDVDLQVTQVGKKCHGDTCSIFREVGKCVMPKEGIFCRVMCGGKIKPDMTVDHFARPLKIMVLTISDRASRGEYEDRSGPRVESLLNDFFEGKRWHMQVSRQIVSDDELAIQDALVAFENDGGDVAVLTGGTGIGPRDVTPEVVIDFCDKIIHGIMEGVRIKYGVGKPNALLSRSVAGVKGSMLVYSIPGSERAVVEYMDEILKTLEHAIFMLHGVSVH